MTDPKAQAETQLRNIEKATGRTVARFATAARAQGLEKHGELVAYFKAEHGLTHGNANALAHAVRQAWEGGPASADSLLADQYRGAKVRLRPIYDELAAIALSLGEDIEHVVQKTGVAFRRKRLFALIQAPSAKRIQLGLNLDTTPNDGRIAPMKGMCTHKVDIAELDAIDDDVAAWIAAAYERAG